MKRKTLVGLIAIVAIAAVVMFAGCVVSGQSVSAETAKEWNEKGISFGMSGEYEKAIECFNKAIELGSNLTSVYENRELALRKLEEQKATQIPAPIHEEKGEPSVEIRIHYSKSWSGCIGTVSASNSIEGRGSATYTIKNPTIVSAVIQKYDDSHDTLTVEIVDNGKVVNSASTNAAYGVASVAYDFTSYDFPTTSVPAFQIIPAIVILLAVAYLLKRRE